MQLTINYREKEVSYQHKDFYLICDVEFSNEERAVAQERGMWDAVTVFPSPERQPSNFYDFKTRAMRFFGIALLLIGLMFSCMDGIANKIGRNDPPPVWLTVSTLFIGGALIFVAYMRDENYLKAIGFQHLTIRRLATEKKFQVHAESLQQAKEYELQVREKLKELADSLRSSRAIPETNTYEL
jgi:hypothetical protein